MSEPHIGFVSRADIARLAGVQRPAVSNWERRHKHFPQPVRSSTDESSESFPIQEVLTWLESRVIPSNARGEGEPVGSTYADRFRRNLGVPTRPALPAKPSDKQHVKLVVDRLMGPVANRFRDRVPMSEYVQLLLGLVYLRGLSPTSWPDNSAMDPPAFCSWADEALRSSTPLGTSSPNWLPDFPEAVGSIADAMNDLSSDTASAAHAFGLIFDSYLDLERHRAEEFFTPRAIARTMAELVADELPARHVLDPFCRAGELLTAVADVRAAQGGRPPAVHGGSPFHQSLRIAEMNLALHSLENELRRTSAEPWLDPPHKSADLVLVNPPFNMRASGEYRHWQYGVPPANSANFAWLQYVIASLGPGGRAVVVMTNNASFSARRGEQDIRRRMVDDGAVDCLIALPARLFSHTAIPVTLWVLKSPAGSCDEILFVNARHLGSMTSRAQRVLADDEIKTIAHTYHDWRRTGDGRAQHFSRGVSLTEIRNQEYSLDPPVYVSGTESTAAPNTDKAALSALIAELSRLQARSADVDAVVDRLLRGISTWTH
jgi:type I restriction enzyme M protein